MSTLNAGAESSAVVRAYRRVLTPSTRYRIDRRVPVRLRYAIKRALGVDRSIGQVPGTVRSELAAMTHRSFYRGTGLAVVRDGNRRVVAQINTARSPLESRRRNFLVVTQALDEAGVDYFCVRGVSDTMTTIGVTSTDWDRVVALIGRLASTSAGYLTLVYGDEEVDEAGGKPGHRPSVVRRARQASALRVTWFRTDATNRAVFGERYGCELQPWKASPNDRLAAPRRNRVTPTVSAGSGFVMASDTLFTRLAPADRDPLPDVRTLVEFTQLRPDDVTFPIDVVFTWVDGADLWWQRKRASQTNLPYHEEAANESRYRSRDELMYALRSIEMYAPWVRNIYVVTDDQRPSWLDDTVPGLQVIDHRDIFTDTSVLPTFNSHAIETQLHHIDGLSEHFLYFNDDMMLGCEVTPQTFFHANGLTVFFPSSANEPQGDRAPYDVPVTAAAKNNREVLRRHFGVSLTQKMRHVPYALRRSVLEEIEDTFSEEIRTTMSNKTRSQNDLSPVSSFYHYYAFATGRAVPGPIGYAYVDLVKADARRTMGLLLAGRDHETFCVNSTRSGDNEISDLEMREFLETYFPTRSRYETQVVSGSEVPVSES